MDELDQRPNTRGPNDATTDIHGIKNNASSSTSVNPSFMFVSNKRDPDLPKGDLDFNASKEGFWGKNSNDFSKAGYGNGLYKTTPIVNPDLGGINESVSRSGTAQERYRYEKERDRDPAVVMAAMNFRKHHLLRNESKDSQFSCFCSTAENILDNSNSHPSFRIYFSFLKRFAISMFVICLLGNTMMAYNVTSSWYSSSDLKFNLEMTTLGNIDGFAYQTVGDSASSIGIDNSQTGLTMILPMDLIITLFFVIFCMYQIFISKIEMNSKNSPISIRNFAVRITNIQKGCNTDLEREVLKLFINYGKIVEIVKVNKYDKALLYELKVRAVGEKIGDCKAKNSIRNSNDQKKINELISKEQRIGNAQKLFYERHTFDKTPYEIIVIFDTLHSRNECLNDYSKYSKWYSFFRKMPNSKKLSNEFKFKVREAFEPSEYLIENWYFSRLLRFFIVFSALVLAAAICSICLKIVLKQMEFSFNKIPIYSDCNMYDFSKSTATSYLASTTASTTEKSCYCRYVGYSSVKSSSGDTKTLCQYWLDYYTDYYKIFTASIGTMLIINVFVTYYFKLIFHPKIIKSRFASQKYILTALCVFIYQFLFLGFLPEHMTNSDESSLGRKWYLKWGVLYIIYYFSMCILHPLETFVLWLVTILRQKCLKSTRVIQKDLNRLYLGVELDYSHKIGRLLAHAFICFYHGAGLPILYLVFFFHITVFYLIEKALVLKIYRKFENQIPYIRQFIIHIFMFMLMFHCFRTIDAFGSEEIFTSSSYSSTCTVSAVSQTCYYPTKRSYSSRVSSNQGIGYLIIAVLAIVYYILIFNAHRKCIKKVIGCNSIFTTPTRGSISVTAIRDRNLAFKPHSYRFDKMDKYKAAIHAVEAKMNERPHSPNQLRGSLNVDSQYDLKSDANSGEEVAGNKDNKQNVFNIYKKGENSIPKMQEPNDFNAVRVVSEELDEVELR